MINRLSFLLQILLVTFISSSSYIIRNAVGKSQRISSSVQTILVDETLTNKVDRLEWKESGYLSWEWRGNKINYVEAGDASKPVLLLIHGFGASVYHWRYNIPVLASEYHVFALDMIGFGLSDKPIIDYNSEVFRDQTLDFIQEVIHQSKIKNGEKIVPCVVAGNSLGGFTALYASASPLAVENNLINGCILLNAAGRFRSDQSAETKEEAKWIIKIKEIFQRFVIASSFYYTKQPARIAQVLRQVYMDKSNIDDELVQSIEFPSRNVNASEVFYRVISKSVNSMPVYIDDLLNQVKVPLFLLWGEKDPWCTPAAADRIQSLFPAALRTDIDAGHCPHDEAPNAVNNEILKFMKTIK